MTDTRTFAGLIDAYKNGDGVAVAALGDACARGGVASIMSAPVMLDAESYEGKDENNVKTTVTASIRLVPDTMGGPEHTLVVSADRDGPEHLFREIRVRVRVLISATSAINFERYIGPDERSVFESLDPSLNSQFHSVEIEDVRL